MGKLGPRFARKSLEKLRCFERGTPAKRPFAGVVNQKSARLLELGLSPQNRLPSSGFWSAKEIEGLGGKETTANLAAKPPKGAVFHRRTWKAVSLKKTGGSKCKASFYKYNSKSERALRTEFAVQAAE